MSVLGGTINSILTILSDYKLGDYKLGDYKLNIVNRRTSDRICINAENNKIYDILV